MALSAKNRRFWFLVAAVITVIIAGILVANVQRSSGRGVLIDQDILDQLTTTITQIMLAFWIVLIGYLIYRFLNSKKVAKTRMDFKTGKGQSLLPSGIVLLIILLIVFFLRPFEPGGLLGGQQGGRTVETNTTTPTPDNITPSTPLLLPAVVMIIALASIVLVWRFLRQKEAAIDTGTDRRQEQAMEVLERAMKSLYAGEDPRSTIIRTYQQMCLLVQVGKIDEEPFLTPKDFAVRAVKELGWKEGPLVDLTMLFEEARYSDHEMGESQKERAIVSLERLKDDLEVRSVGGADQ